MAYRPSMAAPVPRVAEPAAAAESNAAPRVPVLRSTRCWSCTSSNPQPSTTAGRPWEHGTQGRRTSAHRRRARTCRPPLRRRVRPGALDGTASTGEAGRGPSDPRSTSWGTAGRASDALRIAAAHGQNLKIEVGIGGELGCHGHWAQSTAERRAYNLSDCEQAFKCLV